VVNTAGFEQSSRVPQPDVSFCRAHPSLTLFSPVSHAVATEFLAGYHGGVARIERREHRGEPILVSWYDHDEGPAIRDIVRVAEDEGRIASIRFYFFCPEVIAEVAGELGLPWRSNGYGYWPRHDV